MIPASEIEHLESYDGPDKVITSYDMLDVIQAEGEKETTNFLYSKIPSLDGFLTNVEDGHPYPFEGGEMITVSGDGGAGKSLLIKTFTKNFSLQEKCGIVFSYEETHKQFMRKFGENPPYFLVPMKMGEASPRWIAKRIDEAKVKYGKISFIAIDHLHYIVNMGTHKMTDHVGSAARDLKLISVDQDIATFLIVHNNRTDTMEEPTLRSLRDGWVDKESDVVLFVIRKQDEMSVIKIAKARGSGVFDKKVCVKKVGRFLEEDFDSPFANEMRLPTPRVKERPRYGD